MAWLSDMVPFMAYVGRDRGTHQCACYRRARNSPRGPQKYNYFLVSRGVHCEFRSCKCSIASSLRAIILTLANCHREQLLSPYKRCMRHFCHANALHELLRMSKRSSPMQNASLKPIWAVSVAHDSNEQAASILTIRERAEPN